MSDMSPNRITIRVPESLGERLRNHSRLKGETESDLVRAALEAYFEQSGKERLAYEMAEETGIVGCIRRAPKDLSSNRRYFEGFGQ